DFFRLNGGQPFQFQIGSARQPGPRPAQMMSRQQQPAALADAYNEALFALLDTNKDGKLSRAELAAAPAPHACRRAFFLLWFNRWHAGSGSPCGGGYSCGPF